MMYSLDYQRTSDIDWFAECGGIPLHIASNGCRLPDVIDRGHNRAIQRQLAEMEERLIDVMINYAGVRRCLGEDGDMYNYLESFFRFARLGFVSIDTIRNEENIENERDEYVIIAYPKNRCELINPRNLQLPTASLQNLNFDLWQ
jgi:hypothetical protein